MKFRVVSVEIYERDVKLRMPFRFGVVTLTESPQAFVRARIRLAEGREAEGAAAELLAPKWFDKNPALSNEQNCDQLRGSLARAREAYLAGGENTAYGHFMAAYAPGLVAGYGAALLDRALLDALCRALGLSFYDAMRRNVAGMQIGPFLEKLKPATRIAARHTVGLVDPITAADLKLPVGDGLPETLEQVVQTYGHRWFKLKVGGDVRADVERLAAIAAVLDRMAAPYQATLDGNEQYENIEEVAGLWEAMRAQRGLQNLASSIIFIEQPIKRSRALAEDVSRLGREKPLIIDESDDSLEAFPRARELGYRGVSSKTCKGLYKSLINAARCAAWGGGYFMSGEDLTIQPGLALQQDLALVALIGLTHVERNGHHYVNGMASLPAAEQDAFLAAHPDLYERSLGATRVRIRDGDLQISSLDVKGYASAAMPDWNSMRRTQ